MGAETDVTNNEAHNTPANIPETLLRTERGRMIGLMGLLYTAIVSVTLTLFYFVVGLPGTIIAGGLYSSITAFVTYSRTPHHELTSASVFLFAIVPLIITGALIGVLVGLQNLGIGW